MSQLKKLGELAVVAIKARDLPNREVVGKQDPFCVFRLGEEAKKTITDYRGGQHPVWDDQVNLTVYEGKTKMYVQLFDEDAKREDLISEGEVDLTAVIKDGEQDDWYPLSYKNRRAGDIYLELTFYAAKPPPRRQPTRMKPHGYQRVQQHPPLPSNRPVSSHGYPPATSRPLPHAPVTPNPSTSTPNRFTGVGPTPYVPPPATQSRPQVATQHMPPNHLQASVCTPAVAASYPHPAPQPGYPPAPQPRPTTSTTSASGQPLLSAPFRPGHSPQNSYGGNGGYPPQGPPQGFPPQGHSQGHPQGHPPQNFPTQGHPQNFPSQGHPQNFPSQGHPPQNFPSQAYPPHQAPQGHTSQGYHSNCPPSGNARPPQPGYPPSSYPPAHNNYPAMPGPNGFNFPEPSRPPTTNYQQPYPQPSYPPSNGPSGYPPPSHGYPPYPSH